MLRLVLLPRLIMSNSCNMNVRYVDHATLPPISSVGIETPAGREVKGIYIQLFYALRLSDAK